MLVNKKDFRYEIPRSLIYSFFYFLSYKEYKTTNNKESYIFIYFEIDKINSLYFVYFISKTGY